MEYKTRKAPVTLSPPTNQHPKTWCPSCSPTNSVKELKGKVSHSTNLVTKLTWGSSNLDWPLKAPGYLGRRAAEPPSALWHQILITPISINKHFSKDKHTLHFNGHFPGGPGLAGCPSCKDKQRLQKNKLNHPEKLTWKWYSICYEMYRTKYSWCNKPPSERLVGGTARIRCVPSTRQQILGIVLVTSPIPVLCFAWASSVLPLHPGTTECSSQEKSREWISAAW